MKFINFGAKVKKKLCSSNKKKLGKKNVSHLTDRLITRDEFLGDDLEFPFSFCGVVVAAKSCNP